MTRRLLLLLLLIAVGSVVGRQAVAKPPQAELHVASGGSDSGPCTAARPCATFDRAFRAAHAGQTVRVAGGTYGTQTIRGNGNASARVVFMPETGASVRVHEAHIYGSHIEFRSMNLGESWSTYENSTDVVFRGITVQSFYVNSSTNVRIVGGSVGPAQNFHPQISASPTTIEPANIVVDGVSFHDFSRTSSDVHTECLQIGAGTNIVIRNSRFRRCAVMDLFLGYWGDTPVTRNVTVENNLFDDPIDGFYSIQSGVLGNLLIRNNTALAPFWLNEKLGTRVNVRVVANVAPARSWECVDGVSYRYNVWQGASCSPTDRNSRVAFTSERTFNLLPLTKAASVDRGDPSSFPVRDIAGHKRPRGRAPDAGAFEVR